MRVRGTLAALAMALGARAQAGPDAAAQRRAEGALLAFRPLPAEAVAGPAALNRLFDAMRAAPRLELAPVHRPPESTGTVPRSYNRSNSRELERNPNEGTVPLLVPLPLESPEYRVTFKVLLARPKTTDRFDRIILRYGERYGLNPRLLKAIIAAESEFVVRARSPKGALGLMQLAPATAEEMGVAPEALADPESNIRAGAAYLRHLFERAWRRYRIVPSLPFSRAPLWLVQRVIAAYNAGPRFLAREKLFAETREYVRKVTLFLRSPVALLRRHRPRAPEPALVPPSIRPR